MLVRGIVLGIALLSAAGPAVDAQNYVEREVMIPWVEAAPAGLDALLVYADLPGRRPLVVLTHGTSRTAEEHALVTPWQELPQALWFARRGWIVLVVVRRGYGRSGGEKDVRRGGHCPMNDYAGAAEYGAEDLRAAIDYGRRLPQVDPARIVSAGFSTGGLATVALTTHPPPGLVAAISFAGGDGSQGDHNVCNASDLVHAYRNLGKRSRVPMLWIYAENDRYFWPELAQQFDAAFRAGGGDDQLVLAPPVGQDGHSLFRHITAWSATVDGFLAAHRLVPLAQVLPEVQPPNVPAPMGLSEAGQQAFRSYLLLGPHKAFARAAWSFGFSAGQITVDDARRGALENCRRAAHARESCTVVSVDNTPVAHDQAR